MINIKDIVVRAVRRFFWIGLFDDPEPVATEDLFKAYVALMQMLRSSGVYPLDLKCVANISNSTMTGEIADRFGQRELERWNTEVLAELEALNKK